jgi:hypothetical protein
MPKGGPERAARRAVVPSATALGERFGSLPRIAPLAPSRPIRPAGPVPQGHEAPRSWGLVGETGYGWG